MLAIVSSATLFGIDGRAVRVEVHVSSGLPGYTIVGLPDAAARESRDRVRAALLSSACVWPAEKVTVNLAPAEVRKSGAGLEVAIAVGLMIATEMLPPRAATDVAFLGELGLDGSVRRVNGALALVDALRRRGIERVVVPIANAAEAALVPGITVCAARHLAELRDCLNGEAPWPDAPAETRGDATPFGDDLDLADVCGLPLARAALAASAAGRHHLLYVGPPGVGKTMLARRVGTILPALDRDAALEVTRIHSAAGVLPPAVRLHERAPFRSPHHSASMAALVGGGSGGQIRVGEISLAHRGTLFLDELGEFSPAALDALRQPLEDRVVRISRLGISHELPADFVLIACCNPCPCGLREAQCHCGDVQRARYRRRLSAPLLDRFDLRLRLEEPDRTRVPGAPSPVVREQVAAAIDRQRARLAWTPWRANAEVPQGALDHYAALGTTARDALHEEAEARDLSSRGLARMRRVARTLADLADREVIDVDDVLTASSLRQDVP